MLLLRQSDLEYADDVVLMSEELNNLQVFVGRLNDSVNMFGMCCSTAVTRSQTFSRGSCISPAGSTTDSVFAHTVGSTSIRLLIIDRACAVLLYKSEA